MGMLPFLFVLSVKLENQVWHWLSLRCVCKKIQISTQTISLS